MSVNLIKAYVKNILISLNEGVEASVTAKEMVDAINIYPMCCVTSFRTWRIYDKEV